MKKKLLMLTAGFIIAVCYCCSIALASSDHTREEILVNGVRVMKGFSPTSVDKAQRSPEITIQVKDEAYDSKRRLYYFPKDPSSAQKFSEPRVIEESGESLIYSLSDGGYLRTVFVSEDTVVTSSLFYLAPWGIAGLLGGGIVGSRLKLEGKEMFGALAFGAFGGGIFGEFLKRKYALSSTNAESILGIRDRRAQVAESDVNNLPWRVHGRMQMGFSVGDYIGSGTLIGPNHVLTAAHNLYDSDKKEEVGAVSFYPGSHGTNIPWAAEGESWVIHPRYKAPRMPFEQKLYDMAVVKIVDDLGLRTGYIGYSELDSVDGNVTVTGYPGSPGSGRFMYTMDGPLTKVTSERAFYDIDTSPGNSGCGVWKHVDGVGDYCFAVHAYGIDSTDTEEAGRRYNSATLITKEKYDLIKAWTS